MPATSPEILQRLQGNPALGSLAQLLSTMANDSSREANDAATAEKSADAARDADHTLFADADEQAAADELAEVADETDVDEDDDTSYSGGGIFTDDEIASLLIGFVAGAAVVGGGCLMYKLLKD